MKFSVYIIMIGVLCAIPAQAQLIFDSVEVRSTFGRAKEGNTGKLVIDGERICFVNKKDQEYFAIPSKAVTEVFYSRVAGRRIGAAILVSPLLLFSKGRKHYMTLSFNDGEKMVGAIEFKLHKKNYRPILRSVEEVSGVIMETDQEGVKESEQRPAERKPKPLENPPR